MFHPDFIRNYPLDKTIKRYGFFSYAASEALYLSDQEREIITGIFKNIGLNRFYNRQFITRKAIHHDLLADLEKILADYFDNDEALMKGLPSVQQISDRLNVSPRYLSDMLRQLTGQNTQQHIHNKLIEKAKEILSAGHLTIAEIAYKLGFGHPQSFNKLFKQKTKLSPLEFRQSFN